MSDNIAPLPMSVGTVFTKEVLRNGKPTQLEFVEINGQTFSISRGLLTEVRLEDEWYEDLNDPLAVLSALNANGAAIKADLFTFWQRMPDTEPRYTFPLEYEDIAVLPVSSYEHWWKNQIKSRIRSLIRKSEKIGIVVKKTTYDDDFVRGMTEIFNESSMRQGRAFWHYGKDFETIRKQFSRYLFREEMIGAYYKGKMIGFMMLGDTGRFGLTGQIISSIKHRDKATNNALIAKAVKICEERKLNWLIYFYWSDDSLAEFKRRCGFQKVTVPRYYVPISLKGKLALRVGAHRGLRRMMPARFKSLLKRLRRTWYERTKVGTRASGPKT